MNRYDWERQVFASNMNANARLVCLVVGTFGNWTESKTVEMGQVKISEMSGLSRSIVSDIMDALVEQGWLVSQGTGRFNTTIYALSVPPVAETVGKLARVKRKMSDRQLSNLKVGRGNLVAETKEVSCRNLESQLPKLSEVVADSIDTNIEEPSKNIEEHKSPVSDEPVDVDDSLNLQVKEEAEVITTPKRNFLETLEQRSFDRITSNLNQETRQEALNLILTTKVPGRTFEEKVFKVLADLGEPSW